MLARTQCKIDQAVKKQQLKEALKLRSQGKSEAVDKMITEARNFLEANKGLLGHAHVRH